MYRQLMTSFFVHPKKRQKKMERVKGIEPSRPAWKAGALPLSYTRKIKKWSEQQDSNLRPPGPKPGALPNCAMPRH